MTAVLFDRTRRERWTGTTAIVRRDTVACAFCDTHYSYEYTQPALFYHGGHGAAMLRRGRWCHCGAINSGDYLPVNPRRL